MKHTLKAELPKLHQQSVLIRCNFDVPIEGGKVLDDTRVLDCFDTVKALLKQNNQCILIAHAGRPDGKCDPQSSLEPIVPLLEKGLGQQVSFVSYEQMFHQDLASPLILMENLRFFPEEEDNESHFTQQLANCASWYVNESFATAHREHASITGLPRLLPGLLGLSFEREIAFMDQVLHTPKHPLVVVLGGAKLETKLPLIEAFKDVADTILVGGKLAVEIKEHPHPLPSNVKVAALNPDGKDIHPSSAEEFAQAIMKASQVIWNGTMGIFEESQHKHGTEVVAQAVNQTAALTLVGGGDTEAALTELNLESGIDHISSGGGAMLTYLSTGSLVGIEALDA